MNVLGKAFRKSDSKNKKNKDQSEIAACEQKTTSEKEKFGSNKKSRRRMNYEWIGKSI